MGLDIYHSKLVTKRPTKIGFSNDGIYLEDNFGKFNKRDWQFIEPFVKEIEYYRRVKSIFFSIIPSEIEFLMKELKNQDILFAENQINLENEIKSFEEKQSLTQYYKEVITNSPPWNQIKYFDKEIKSGFYTKQVGYQREGMKSEFWTYFNYKSKYHYYFDKEDFLKAYSFVGHHWEHDSKEDIRLRKERFKTGFVDQFENGKSFMTLSF
ncbi:MAG: hypothetical protein AB8F94_02610 [Saprospiraceae bacterium]